ncbi:PelD GGDEF domain-containing protein [Legionella spiritensis]|uniref:PelD GGDEF domain-containing protein n=1 Tax=Legionella spiritensis TaxID=452 RepID=A0A0W0YXU0_LEGSP|nr:PelD GGDEF domain-containing protein [Legionella spiritensis]KTD61687.1 hypothetical protein Lspi_2317 [Legionella spiritensis]SNV38938.1 Uncharacterised protein [Legionella spiritensis]
MKFEKDFSIALVQRRSSFWKSIETILITLLLLLLIYLKNPNDPFSIMGPVPWIIFAPVFCSLFYGAAYGMSSLILILLFIIFQLPKEIFYDLRIREYIIGITGLTALASVFSSYWISRIRHVEHLNHYVREHLENLSRDYFLLRISHENIEQAYIVKPLSFREAFSQIKQYIIRNDCEINEENGQFLLGIFSQYCSINNAAFCLYNEKNKDIQAVAFLGKEFPISPNDPLVKNAIDNKVSTYLAISRLTEEDDTDFLAVIPLFNDERDTIGFVIIKDMPFWSLTHDNLEVLSVFAAYFAMQWSIIREISPLLKDFPDFSPDFLSELRSVIQLKKYSNVDSSLSYFLVPPGVQQQNIVYLIERQKRALDCFCVLTIKQVQFIVVLMPLTSMEGIFGYKKRMTDLFKSELGVELNKQDVLFRYHQIRGQSESDHLINLIEEATHAIT